MNFDKWTYKEFSDAFNYYRDGNSEELNKLLTKVTSVDYEAMGFEESTKAKYEAVKEMNEYLKNLDISTCTVDFTKGKWNDKKFRDFRDALQNREVDKVEALACEVAFFPDEDVLTPLSARQGCMMIKAIQQRYQDLLLGKV